MKRYTAITRGGSRLLTVGANNEDEARQEVDRQLSKPGRQDVRRVWREHGRQIQEN